MLRGLLVTFHLIGLAASISLFIATYQANGAILKYAQSRVIESARPVADTSAATIRKSLQHPNLTRWLDGKPRASIEQQLRAYEESPDAWMQELFEQRSTATQRAQLAPEVENPFARRALELIRMEWSNLQQHMSESYQKLLTELRIFSSINGALFLLSAVLCLFRTNARTRFWLISFSCLMLTALILSISFYINQNWIWNILLSRYQGWWYSVSVSAFFLFLCLHILPRSQSEAPQP